MGNLSFGLAFLFLPFLLGDPAVIPDPLGLPQAEELIRELSLVRDGEERAVARRFGRMAAVVDASSVEALFFPGNLSVLIHHKGTQDLHDSLPESVQNLLIVAPTQDGLYPVMLFFHGSTLKNHQYRQLFEHIASHGYIVVAPQLSEEDYVKPGAAVANWTSEGLQKVLPAAVRPDLHKVAVAGHSKGGHTTFALGLKYEQTTLDISVLLGIDPGAGLKDSTGHIVQLKPEVLTYGTDCLNTSMPTMVIGTGLGGKQKGKRRPCSAPEGANHAEFYRECRQPCYHFVVKDYGHVDMLDDDVPVLSCVTGEGSRGPMRRSIAGLVVAFLEAHLGRNMGDLDVLVSHPGVAPVTLDPVEEKRAALMDH